MCIPPGNALVRATFVYSKAIARSLLVKSASHISDPKATLVLNFTGASILPIVAYVTPTTSTEPGSKEIWSVMQVSLFDEIWEILDLHFSL